MPDDKGVESIRLNTINSKPTVHYADNVNVDSPSLSYQTRFGTLGEPPDRPPIDRPSSVTGTDDEDEDEDYDWSGEDDLVDEEAKFEQKMGIKTTPKGWFRR
jgi:hypothetical protein